MHPLQHGPAAALAPTLPLRMPHTLEGPISKDDITLDKPKDRACVTNLLDQGAAQGKGPGPRSTGKGIRKGKVPGVPREPQVVCIGMCNTTAWSSSAKAWAQEVMFGETSSRGQASAEDFSMAPQRY